MPDSKTIHPDAVQAVIDKTLKDLKSKLSPAEFTAIETVAAEGRILDIEAIFTVAEDDSAVGDEQ